MRVRTRGLMQMKEAGEPIVCITAYDFPTARLVDEAGIPVILVGDSLGNVVLGYDSTIPVTLDDVLYHTRAVARAASNALVVADMPFMTYSVSPEDALRNAARLLQEGGAQAVKLEGGTFVATHGSTAHGERRSRDGPRGPDSSVRASVGRLPRTGTHR